MRVCKSVAAEGLGLVELLVTMALAAVLSLMLVEVFAQGHRNAAVENELARMRENGRFLSGLLQRELAMAGFMLAGPRLPPPPAPPVAVDCGAGNWALDMSVPLDMVNDAVQPPRGVGGALFTCLGRVDAVDGVVPATDVLILKRTAADTTLHDGRYSVGVTGPRETQWYLKARAQDYALEWIYVDEGGRLPHGVVGPGNGVNLREYYARMFYVRAWAGRAGDGIPTLCVEQLSGNRMATDCLVEGVEDMQLEWALDTDEDGVADTFTDSPTAADLGRAVRARYFLLLRSLRPLAWRGARTSFELGSKRVTPAADGFYRRLLSGVVELRNIAAIPTG